MCSVSTLWPPYYYRLPTANPPEPSKVRSTGQERKKKKQKKLPLRVAPASSGVCAGGVQGQGELELRWEEPAATRAAPEGVAAQRDMSPVLGGNLHAVVRGLFLQQPQGQRWHHQFLRCRAALARTSQVPERMCDACRHWAWAPERCICWNLGRRATHVAPRKTPWNTNADERRAAGLCSVPDSAH